MPTGYTDNLTDTTTLQEFALRCARAFGALMHMREEPMQAPITQAQPSDYHMRGAEEAEKRIAALQAMTPEAAEAEAAASYAARISQQRQHEEERRERQATYERMVQLVLAWTPPTTDHQNLKDFMLEQLNTSIRGDCSTAGEPVIEPLTGEQWRGQGIADASWLLEYHQRKHEEEVERVAGRNKWVEQLRASLASAQEKQG